MNDLLLNLPSEEKDKLLVKKVLQVHPDLWTAGCGILVNTDRYETEVDSYNLSFLRHYVSDGYGHGYTSYQIIITDDIGRPVSATHIHKTDKSNYEELTMHFNDITRRAYLRTQQRSEAFQEWLRKDANGRIHKI